MSVSAQRCNSPVAGAWVTLRRHEPPSGRMLDCLVLAQCPPAQELLSEGIAELACRIQEVVRAPRGEEHAGAAVIFGLRQDPQSVLALAAVRGFVLSAAQELGQRLKLNLVVHRGGESELQSTLDYLADPLSAYVHAATLVLGDPQP